MKIPKDFTLNGIKYTVHIVNEDGMAPNTWGMTNKKTSQIYISEELAQDSREQTFLHELLHVLIFQMSIDTNLELNTRQEEIFVNALANGLYGAIKQGIIKC